MKKIIVLTLVMMAFVVPGIAVAATTASAHLTTGVFQQGHPVPQHKPHKKHHHKKPHHKHKKPHHH